MPEIIHSTNAKFKGPWLIGREKLLELDKTFEDEWQKLLKIRSEFINAKVNDANPKDEKEEIKLRNEISNSYGNRAERSLLIYLKSARRMKVANFDEAFRETALLNETPIGFSLSMEVRNIKLELEVRDEEGFLSFGGDDPLRLNVSPDTNKDAKGMFAVFRTWVDTCKPPIWQTIWINCRFLLFIFTPWLF